jgi:hypothetical protein
MTAASAITAQRAVAVNTSGQAFEIGVTANTLDLTTGTAQPTTPVTGYGTLSYNAYDPVNDRYLFLSIGSGTQKPSVFVVQCSDTGIVFGTPVALNAATAANRNIGTVAYDATAQKFLVSYTEITTGYPAAVVVTINPTTNAATLGTPTVIDSNVISTPRSSTFYNPGIGKCIVSWVQNATNNTVRSAVATITGTSVAFGATATFVTPSTGIVSDVSLSGVAHPTNGKFLILCGDTSYAGFNACAATVSGTTITFGTPVQFNPWGWGNYCYGITNGIWDSLRSQFIFGLTGVSNSGGIASFTITGTTTVNNIAISSAFAALQRLVTDLIAYNSVQNIINVSHLIGGQLPITNTGAAFVEGNTSAAFISGGSIAYSPTKNRTLFIGNAIGQAANGLTNYTSGTYVGIASASVSGGSPCVINVIGSSATVSGAAPGSGYAIQTIGGLVPVTTLTLGTYAGVSTASNTILLKG